MIAKASSPFNLMLHPPLVENVAKVMAATSTHVRGKSKLMYDILVVEMVVFCLMNRNDICKCYSSSCFSFSMLEALIVVFVGRKIY